MQVLQQMLQRSVQNICVTILNKFRALYNMLIYICNMLLHEMLMNVLFSWCRHRLYVITVVWVSVFAEFGEEDSNGAVKSSRLSRWSLHYSMSKELRWWQWANKMGPHQGYLSSSSPSIILSVKLAYCSSMYWRI